MCIVFCTFVYLHYIREIKKILYKKLTKSYYEKICVWYKINNSIKKKNSHNFFYNNNK